MPCLRQRRRENKIHYRRTAEKKVKIGRKLRFGRYRRKHRARKPDKDINLRHQSYYKSPVQPDHGRALGLRIIEVKDRVSSRLYPAWLALTNKSHQRKFAQNSVVYSAFIYHNPDNIRLNTRYTSITIRQLINGVRIEQVRDDLVQYINNYTVVSHELLSDLSCLNILYLSNLCVDLSSTTKGFTDKNNKPIDLRIISFAVNKKRINEFKIGHESRSALTEASAVIKAYYQLKSGRVKTKIDANGTTTFDWLIEVARRDEQIACVLKREAY